jgi:hypothetical protein
MQQCVVGSSSWSADKRLHIETNYCREDPSEKQTNHATETTPGELEPLEACLKQQPEAGIKQHLTLV